MKIRADVTEKMIATEVMVSLRGMPNSGIVMQTLLDRTETG